MNHWNYTVVVTKWDASRSRQTVQHCYTKKEQTRAKTAQNQQRSKTCKSKSHMETGRLKSFRDLEVLNLVTAECKMFKWDKITHKFYKSRVLCINGYKYRDGGTSTQESEQLIQELRSAACIRMDGVSNFEFHEFNFIYFNTNWLIYKTSSELIWLFICSNLCYTTNGRFLEMRTPHCSTLIGSKTKEHLSPLIICRT